MAYWKDTYRFRDSIEYEYKYAGRYGAKGEKRSAKRKATPEQVKKQNQHNRENKIRRLIKANFKEGDLWTTLKYPAGTKKRVGDVFKDLNRFITNMRREYKKSDTPFKYIYRVEVGKYGGGHIHILINKLDGIQTDELIQKKWKYGRANFTGIYDAGGYSQLASYIVKQEEESAEQLSLFPEDEQKELTRYSCSRNLIRPVAERKVYGHWTMRRILRDGPKATEGYFVDKNSVVYGVNPYTGMSYYRYTEVRIKKEGDYLETGQYLSYDDS